MKKRKLFTLLSLTMAFAFVFTACKEKPKPDANKPKIEEEEVKPASKHTEIIKASNPNGLPDVSKNRKDMLIVGFNAPEGKFNSIYSGTVDDAYVCSLIYDGLISNDAEGNPTANVAEKWEISEDGKTYTFKLKKGIKFSSGDELTAEDVAFTYTAICDPNYKGSRFDAVEKLLGYEKYHKGDAKEVEGIKVIDPYTISFTLTEPKAPAIYDFGYGIMPKKYYGFEKGKIKELEDKFLKPVGSGAYIFKEYKPGQEVVLEKNPNYWKGEPKIKTVILKAVTAENMMQQIKAGEIDVCRVSAKPENVQELKEAGFLNMQLYPGNGYGYMGLNLRNEKFKDKRVRQALAYGLDRKGFANAYFGEYADVCNGPVSPVSWAYTDDLNKYEYDADKANKLLDEAGWVKKDDGFRYKDGKKFTISWYTYSGSKYVETLIPIVKDNWKKLGIDVVPEMMEFATLCTKVYDEQNFEMFNMAWSLSIDPDSLGIFGISQDVKGGFNAGGWRNEDGEKLLQEGLKTTKLEERKEIYKKWLQIANDDLPYIFLDMSKEMWAVSSKVKGLDLSPYIDFTLDVYKAEIK
ncbi:ABC transporter substrate-binding protein [Haloimpatiens lingqiaonensis]|uniref:ABC transporter substrate-binding protein n=1 Tax=Haloimpatiens lingqiaonensis TaxID=1380675 RepID=UPI0010FE6C8A|nr:ABC transporter substrate-binding protein [Haloimpatiens lingqiaonensis]